MAYTARANINHEGTKISRGKVISDSEYKELPAGLKKKFVGRPDKADDTKSKGKAKISTAALKDNTGTKTKETSESETESTEKEETSETAKSDEAKTGTKAGSKKDEEKTKEPPKRQR